MKILKPMSENPKPMLYICSNFLKKAWTEKPKSFMKG